MRNPPLIFLLLFLLTLLSACAGPRVGSSSGSEPPSAPAPASQPPAVTAPEAGRPSDSSSPPAVESVPQPLAETEELPAVDLDGELLYQILAAEIALQRQYFAAGINEYLRLAQRTRDPRFAERATQVAVFAYDNETALRAARLWLELQPERSEPRQMAVVAAIRSGQLEEALGHMEVLLSDTEGLPEERFELMASLLSREHDVQEAFRLMQRFVAKRQDDPNALYAYAHLAVRAGEMEKARQAIDAALELRPGWHNAVALRIRILLLSDGSEAAVAYLGGAVRDYPEDTNLRMAYARTLTDMQRFEEALEQYGILAGQVTPNTDVLLSMAMIHLQLDRIDEAETLLRQVQETSGNGGDLQFYLGWIAEKRGDIEQAIAHYASLPPDARNHFEGRLRIVILTAGEGDIAGARRQLQTLRTDEPDQQRRLYQVEAELLRQANMDGEAMEVLNAALATFPDDFDLLYARALLAETMDRLDVVEADLRLILLHEPSHVNALNALGYTLADRTERYKEAYDYISRALEMSPDNNAILDSMGWVLYRLGQYEESIRYLERSLEIKHDHEVAAHLGEVLWVSGREDEARAVWQRALEAFPEDELLRDTMRRFGQ